MKNLDDIFRCDDQCALIHNNVASEDPAPGAWSHHSAPQSPLGRVFFPEMLGGEVVAIAQGQLFTRGGPGQLIEHSLTGHEWLPWGYFGHGHSLRVDRTVTRDLWLARLRLEKNSPALLLLDVRSGTHLLPAFRRHDRGLHFQWGEQFVIDIEFRPASSVRLSDDPAPLKREFLRFRDVRLNEGHCRWAWESNRRLWLGVWFTGQMEVRFRVQPTGDRRAGRRPAASVSFPGAQRAEKRRWEEFFEEQVPHLDILSEGLAARKDIVLRDTWFFGWQTLWSNRCEGTAGLLKRPFTSPSRLAYGAQWWYDEPFNSVAYRHLRDPWIAYVGFENFWAAQRPDGAIPGNVRLAAAPPLAAPPLAASQSLMTMQPPIIGLVLQLLREKPGWPGDVRPMYESLLRLARWHLGPRRDTDRDGLAEYHHCFDGPADQSQRWDSQKLDPAKVIDELRPTESVDMNVWMALLWQVLGEMAAQLGDAKAAGRHAAKAVHTMELIEEFMWDERDGFYYDIDGRTHRKIRVKTPYNFMPLLWPRLPPGRAERLVREHLFNPKEFWCRYPLPSVSLDHPTFDPVNMFRGPTWVNQNWLVVEGLERQGFQREAKRLAWKTIELVGPRYRGGRRIRSPRFYEWYHPHTGEALGNPQYAWSGGLVVDLILRFFASGNVRVGGAGEHPHDV